MIVSTLCKYLMRFNNDVGLKLMYQKLIPVIININISGQENVRVLDP